MTMILFENTFVSLQEADDYLQNCPYADFWFNLDSLKKEQALIFATFKINNFNFVGKKLNSSQTLEFPRNFAFPQDIKNAVCEEAIAILDKSAHAKNKHYGISSVSLGNSSVSYFDKENLGLLLSKEAYNLVSKWTVKNFDIR